MSEGGSCRALRGLAISDGELKPGVPCADKTRDDNPPRPRRRPYACRGLHRPNSIGTGDAGGGELPATRSPPVPWQIPQGRRNPPCVPVLRTPHEEVELLRAGVDRRAAGGHRACRRLACGPAPGIGAMIGVTIDGISHSFPAAWTEGRSPGQASATLAASSSAAATPRRSAWHGRSVSSPARRRANAGPPVTPGPLASATVRPDRSAQRPGLDVLSDNLPGRPPSTNVRGAAEQPSPRQVGSEQRGRGRHPGAGSTARCRPAFSPARLSAATDIGKCSAIAGSSAPTPGVRPHRGAGSRTASPGRAPHTKWVPCQAERSRASDHPALSHR